MTGKEPEGEYGPPTAAARAAAGGGPVPGGGTQDRPPAVPLARNRDYRLLWTAQMLSEFGGHVTVLAFPLLALALTGSAVASGVVLSSMAAAQLATGLPAGALADRHSRKGVMLACEAAQAVAAFSLVAAVWWGTVTVLHMAVVAAVFGGSAALFEPAESATLPNLVPAEQLPTAVAVNNARSSLGQLSGTAAGGFLFAVGRVVPFLTDTITHTAAFLTLLPLRVPPRPPVPDGPRTPFLHDIAGGLRWVWQERGIRVTMLCAGALNLFFSAFYLIVIVRAQSSGTSPGGIGVMAAMLGAGGLAGALAAPALYRRLSPRAAVVLVFWALAALTPLTLLTPPGPATGVVFAAMALFPPVANTAIVTQQLLRTPDALRGRLTSVIGLIAGGAAAGGPALGGLLAAAMSTGHALVVCWAGITVLTVLTTASPALRGLSAPSVPDPAAPGTARLPI